MTIRPFEDRDIPEMTTIWNEVVETGTAFPQEEPLNEATAREFFSSQTLSAVAEDGGAVVGLYILHPNNTGRCGHICNASYAVSSEHRSRRIGEALVRDCIERAPTFGFRILQFNAVVESNLPARRLYERLGFHQLGTIPAGFRMKDGTYANICPYYIPL